MTETTYTCKTCGQPVPLVGGVPKRTCGCVNPTIVANLHAKVVGVGGTNVGAAASATQESA